MRLCKKCSAMVRFTAFRCYRCGRIWPGISRRALRHRTRQAALALLGGLAALFAFALAT